MSMPPLIKIYFLPKKSSQKIIKNKITDHNEKIRISNHNDKTELKDQDCHQQSDKNLLRLTHHQWPQ